MNANRPEADYYFMGKVNRCEQGVASEDTKLQYQIPYWLDRKYNTNDSTECMGFITGKKTRMARDMISEFGETSH